MKEKVINAKFQPLNDERIVEGCMDDSEVSEILGLNIIAYRIRWHKYDNFEWSAWFIPGVNDLYKKDNEPERRYIACFNDHEFEVIGVKNSLYNRNKLLKDKML